MPPNYWLTDPGVLGGAFGFLTEGGPGENPMVFDSLAVTVPAADLWPPAPNDCWGHCANPEGLFGELFRFNAPLAARYGVNSSNASLGVRAYLFAAHAQVKPVGFVPVSLNDTFLFITPFYPSCRHMRVTAPCLKHMREIRLALGATSELKNRQMPRVLSSGCMCTV